MRHNAPAERVRFAIDRGGTFTDIYAEYGNSIEILKLLSEDPENYQDAPLEGIRRILRKIGFPGSTKIQASAIDWVRMGTTLATNALLERDGEKVALITTRGFGDLLQIGYQDRPDIFDLKIEKPSLLYDCVLEVDERIRPAQKSDTTSLIVGETGEFFKILQKPDLTIIRSDLIRLMEQGTTSLAIAFLHAYACPIHEIAIASIAKELGFSQVSISSETMPMLKIIPRGDTTVVDAYLTPIIKLYINAFQEGFDHKLSDNQLLFMQSDGGLSPADGFKGSNAILSGPAGGVVGYGLTAFSRSDQKPVIGFDMGGTSTDVSRYDGDLEIVHETTTAGVRLQAPQLQINTVAAGGGSRLFFENKMFKVGPLSAGSHPGPLCYRKNGFLTVTDANIVLGRINPDYFPSIFGVSGDLPLDPQPSREGFKKIASEINHVYEKQGEAPLSIEEIASGFLAVANQTMVKAIQEISVMRGFDIKEHILASFGGAGGQHACAIAAMLGISEIYIHRFSGILSAYGMGLADVVMEKQSPAALEYSPKNYPKIFAKLDDVTTQAREELLAQGHTEKTLTVKRYLHLRYQGTNNSFMVLEPTDGDFKDAYKKRHQREFGFDLQDRELIVDDVRVRAASRTPLLPRQKIALHDALSAPPSPVMTSCYFNNSWQETPIYSLDDLGASFQIQGPAMLINETSTIIVEPESNLLINEFGDMTISINTVATQQTMSHNVDPIQLSIFSNLFISVAEQMGRTLQKTAISTNIKERLDFSCAIFDNKGRLVANAPHIPVHLGAMGHAVQEQIKLKGEDLREGDVLLSNHPAAGGSHLPDMTVITPVWHEGKILFFTASRGHHADIGGMTPGSMPPFSRFLTDEGAAILSCLLVSDGIFQEKTIRHLLKDSRKVEDNIADLKAQIAANKRGIDLLHGLIQKYSIETVLRYMGHIQDCAADAVRDLLQKFTKDQGNTIQPLCTSDMMDDGSIIALEIRIDPENGNAVFDFTGTGHQVLGNWNVPRAVVSSAIIYSLRSLLQSDLPLNYGCLDPITIITPKNSLLSPSKDAAVVGGNVLTSQRIVDVIFKAFQAVSASQGCMNNLTFGNSSFGYYETIGGGAGAGPSWHGQSGVHTHMTNTRSTDPEILEKRYPVLLRQFSIRKGSGGKGEFNGGDGLIREIEALEEIDTAILSERRVFRPYGLHGGKPGMTGENLYIRNDNTVINLGGKNQVTLSPGDRLRIQTPGGGGFGPAKPLPSLS